MARYKPPTVPQRTVSDQTLKSIGRRLVWLRMALGHTQADWSRRLRVSNPQLNKWEAGTRLPHIDVLITICEASSVSMDYFFRGIVSARMPLHVQRYLYQHHLADLSFESPPTEASHQ
jgi:transcriptional regulator with XRE-family HTH domain